MGAAARVLWAVPAAALASVALLLLLGGGMAEVVFGTFMIGGLLIGSQLALEAWRGARREASRARGLARTRPEDLARLAVADERRRLLVDIEATIRETLLRIVDEAGAVDGPPSLRRIQHQARAAASELRRQLGLIRQTDSSDVRELPAVGSPPSRRAHGHLRTSDWVLGGCTAMLAALEIPWVVSAGDMTTASVWRSGVLTAMAAGTVTWRRTSPAVAALGCSALVLGGWVSGSPVGVGLWYLVTAGGLLWTLAARGRLVGLGGLALGLLSGVPLLVVAAEWPANLGVVVVIDAVAIAGGLTARLLAHRHDQAEAAAAGREWELRQTVDTAVQAERASLARDLHDVVSHAVGLVAVQAAAAEVTWDTDRTAALAAVDLVRATAADTLADLDRLLPGADSADKSWADLEALVERIRASGTAVTLGTAGLPSPSAMPIAYRVVHEALTNVVRHASGASATVMITRGPEGTVVQVVDDGPGHADGVSRGYGLVGLAERVSLAGGTFNTATGPDACGFRVRAVLPETCEEVSA